MEPHQYDRALTYLALRPSHPVLSSFVDKAATITKKHKNKPKAQTEDRPASYSIYNLVAPRPHQGPPPYESITLNEVIKVLENQSRVASVFGDDAGDRLRKDIINTQRVN